MIDLCVRAQRVRAFAGLDVTELAEVCVGSKYDVTISFTQLGDGALQARIGWHVNLYHTSTIDRLGTGIIDFLVQVTGQPQVAISTLRSVSGKEA